MKKNKLKKYDDEFNEKKQEIINKIYKLKNVLDTTRR